jgi:hypothetical protein
MEVGLGSLSPEHRAELARARMTVVPIPRGLGQSSSGGSGNVPTPPGGWIQPISSEGISGPVPATAAAAVIVNMPGVQPTTNAQGTGPAGCPAGSALRLVYASPTVKQKLNLAPVHVQGGLSQQQLQAIYGAYVLNFSLLPANANPGSTYPLQTPLSFTYNGISYLVSWRRYGNWIAAVIDVCVPHATAIPYAPLVPALPAPIAPVAPATDYTWLYILGAVVIGGVVIYAVD